MHVYTFTQEGKWLATGPISPPQEGHGKKNSWYATKWKGLIKGLSAEVQYCSNLINTKKSTRALYLWNDPKPTEFNVGNKFAAGNGMPFLAMTFGYFQGIIQSSLTRVVWMSSPQSLILFSLLFLVCLCRIETTCEWLVQSCVLMSISLNAQNLPLT